MSSQDEANAMLRAWQDYRHLPPGDRLIIAEAKVEALTKADEDPDYGATLAAVGLAMQEAPDVAHVMA